MNILVTGGAGFIGSQMARRHLADGHRVVVVDDLSTGLREKVPEGARFVQARHRRDGPRAAPAGGEDRLRLAPRGADRRAPQRLRSPLRRALQRARIAEALRGVPPRGRAPRPLLLDGRSPLRRAGGRRARRREEPPDQPDLPLRLRQALDREVPPLLPASSTASRPVVFRYANVYGPGQNGTGEAGVVAIFCRGHPRAAAHRRSAATATRPATTSSSATCRSGGGRGGPRRNAAAPGTSERESRRRSTVSSSCSRASLGYARNREHVAAPPGEQRRSVLDGSAIRRDFDLPPWTPLAKGTQSHRRTLPSQTARPGEEAAPTRS